MPPKVFTSEPPLIVIRSFDINKPGCEVDDLKEGVAGGDIVSKDREGKFMYSMIFFKTVSLFGEHDDLLSGAPGSLIEVGLKIGPTLFWADRMVKQVLDAAGAFPEIFTELEPSYFLLRRLLGACTEGDQKAAKVQKL